MRRRGALKTKDSEVCGAPKGAGAARPAGTHNKGWQSGAECRPTPTPRAPRICSIRARGRASAVVARAAGVRDIESFPVVAKF